MLQKNFYLFKFIVLYTFWLSITLTSSESEENKSWWLRSGRNDEKDGSNPKLHGKNVDPANYLGIAMAAFIISKCQTEC